MLSDLPAPEAWWIHLWGFLAGVCVCHTPNSQASGVVLQEPLFPKSLTEKNQRTQRFVKPLEDYM